jgi:NADH-quinone oxidoreductase subunit L
MTVPLIVLAVFAAFMGLMGTPWWPGLQSYLGAVEHPVSAGSVLGLMAVSTAVVGAGLWFGWRLYGRRDLAGADDRDVLERFHPRLYGLLRDKFLIDELYAATVVRWPAGFSRFCQRLDERVLDAAVGLVTYAVLALSWAARLMDDYGVNVGFDRACERARRWGGFLSRTQDGQVHHYLRALALAFAVLLLFWVWGGWR